MTPLLTNSWRRVIFLYPEEGVREGQMCWVISVSNPEARLISTEFEAVLAWQPWIMKALGDLWFLLTL